MFQSYIILCSHVQENLITRLNQRAHTMLKKISALRTWSTSRLYIDAFTYIPYWYEFQSQCKKESQHFHYFFSLLQDAKETYENYYRKQRKKQARLALQPPTNMVSWSYYDSFRKNKSNSYHFSMRPLRVIVTISMESWDFSW